MPADGSCDGCVLREGYLNARLHDGGPFRHSTHKRWVGLFTDGSVKLFASHRDAAPASVLSDITSAELDALALPGGTAATPPAPVLRVMRHGRAVLSLSGTAAELMEWYAAFSEVITWAQHDESASAWPRGVRRAREPSDAAADAEVAALGLPAAAADSPGSSGTASQNDDGEQQTPPRQASLENTHKERTTLAKAMRGLRFGASTGGAPPSADLATAQRDEVIGDIKDTMAALGF